MTDRLTEIVTIQKEFQLNFFDPDSIDSDKKIALTKEFILSLHRELGEVLNSVPWKLHRANEVSYDTSHIQEELIDCLKFLLNLFIVWQMTDSDIYNEFLKKTEIVKFRYEEEKNNIKSYGAN